MIRPRIQSEQELRPNFAAARAPESGFGDRSVAYAVLRVTLGLNILLHGLVRLPKLEAFATGMVRGFEATPLPPFLIYPFALAIPFAEAVIGALVLTGLFTRAALAAGGLLMAALVFGTALQENWELLAIQMLYALLYYVLLANRADDRLSLDALHARRRAPAPPPVPYTGPEVARRNG